MNRNVMKRQMFAGGGAAFPDLSGDGEITQRDILMGRGVQFMQEGGIASMGMDPMAGAPMAAGPEQMDPQVLEGAMMTASENFGALDDAQNYEEVIDSIRGDALPIEQRYQELAQFVGPQDAQQTPESVLAMVQPVIQMAAVDGGIGGLASDEMNAEVSGPMAEGIMSTIAMEGGEEPPVNFSQGGDARRNTQDVRYYADGGPIQYFAPENPRVVQPNALNRDDLYAQAQARYQGAAGFQDQQTQFDERKNLTQSQMLFDIAGAGLALAGGDGSKSFAQNLADAAQNTQLFDKLSARTASLADYKDSQAKERRDINLAALKSSEDEFRAISAAEVASKNEMKKLNRTNAFRLLVLNKEQTFNKGQNETNRDHALTLADKRGDYQLQLQNLQNDNSTEAIKLRGDLQKELAEINNQANSALAGDKFDQQMKIRGLNSADQFGQIALQHSNAMDRLSQTDGNELKRIKLNQEFTTKRDDHLAGIAAAAAENNQVYQAYQNSLERLQKWEVTKFNAELSKELQERGFDQNAIDREIKAAQQTFDNNVTEDKLNLQNYIAATDTQYKLRKLKIDEAAANVRKSNFANILSADGSTVVGVIDENASNATAQLNKIQKEFPGAFIGTTPKTLEKQAVQFKNGDVQYFNKGSVELSNALAEDGATQVNDATLTEANDLGSSFDAQTIELISDEDLMNRYALNKDIDSGDVVKINNALTTYMAGKPVFNIKLGKDVLTPRKLDADTIALIKQRIKNGGNGPAGFGLDSTGGLTTEEVTDLVGTPLDGGPTVNLANAENSYDALGKQEIKFKGVDGASGVENIKNATGIWNSLGRLANVATETFFGVQIAPKSSEAKAQLQALNLLTVLSIQKARQGKNTTFSSGEIYAVLPKVSDTQTGFLTPLLETDGVALDRINSLIPVLENDIANQVKRLKNPENTAEFNEIQENLNVLRSLKNTWQNVQEVYSGGFSDTSLDNRPTKDFQISIDDDE